MLVWNWTLRTTFTKHLHAAPKQDERWKRMSALLPLQMLHIHHLTKNLKKYDGKISIIPADTDCRESRYKMQCYTTEPFPPQWKLNHILKSQNITSSLSTLKHIAVVVMIQIPHRKYTTVLFTKHRTLRNRRTAGEDLGCDGRRWL